MSGAASESGLSRLRDLSFAQGVNKPTARLASHVNDQEFFPSSPKQKGKKDTWSQVTWTTSLMLKAMQEKNLYPHSSSEFRRYGWQVEKCVNWNV